MDAFNAWEVATLKHEDLVKVFATDVKKRIAGEAKSGNFSTKIFHCNYTNLDLSFTDFFHLVKDILHGQGFTIKKIRRPFGAWRALPDHILISWR